MSEADGYYVEQWKLARKSEEIAPATYKNDVRKIKTFMRWCEAASYIESGVGDAIQIPDIPEEDEVSHEKITKEQADAVLRYLSNFKYGSRQHALFFTLWETGCRVSGAIALDVGDLNPAKQVLEFRNRRETGTSLKNGPKGERNVTTSEELVSVLNDYIEIGRPDVVDEYGRKPLFCIKSGRVKRQRVYKNVTGYTRPCKYQNHCPHGMDMDECEWTLKRRAFGCPSSVSTHPIRRGSITHHLNAGWPKDKVSDRCDVSIETLDKHYNEQSKEDERQARRKYVDLL